MIFRLTYKLIVFSIELIRREEANELFGKTVGTVKGGKRVI